ncbi:MAG: hypothetical protein IT379_34175 [Deltaproteobacteria bacterium]|nr:hypothetical protein [Deltaproteobacteria bacterium]
MTTGIRVIAVCGLLWTVAWVATCSSPSSTPRTASIHPEPSPPPPSGPPRVVSVGLLEVDLGPPSSTPSTCVDSITVTRSCTATLEGPTRRTTTISARTCTQLFDLVEREIAPRMQVAPQCDRIYDVRMHLSLRYERPLANGVDTRRANVAGCHDDVPWRRLFEMLYGLRCGIAATSSSDGGLTASDATTERALPVADLIGRSRAEVERGRDHVRVTDEWVVYADGIEVRFGWRDGIALAVRTRVQAGTDCVSAARAMGFTPIPGSSPLRRADGCAWPGISDRHRLAPDVAARLSGTTFEVWLRR